MFGDKASPKTEAEPLFPGMSEDRNWFQDSVLGMCGFPKQCRGALGRQGPPPTPQPGGEWEEMVLCRSVKHQSLFIYSASWALILNSRIQALKALEDGEDC